MKNFMQKNPIKQRNICNDIHRQYNFEICPDSIGSMILLL